MLFVAWVLFFSSAVGSQKSKRELTSPFLLDLKQDLCVCAADFWTPIEMENEEFQSFS